MGDDASGSNGQLSLHKEAVVIHSGGMDSSICLALAIKEFGANNVLSLSFNYQQRHSPELIQAAQICRDWGVDHTIIKVDCLAVITENALTNKEMVINCEKTPNTLVVGRNGLMAKLGGIHANHLGARCIYMGVLGLEGNHSGYRDCSREYMDLQQQILRLDLDDPSFEIRTPLVFMTKKETLALANQLGVLDYLLDMTITCYEGLRGAGCRVCPGCHLRNEGIAQYYQE